VRTQNCCDRRRQNCNVAIMTVRHKQGVLCNKYFGLVQSRFTEAS